jgi:CBS domain-containing protein
MYELRPNSLIFDMATSQIEVESRVTELATQAFKAFCDDISGTFGVDIECEQQAITAETVAGLRKRFNKLVAVNIVDSEGLLGGTFQFIFDQEGLFTLGGIIIMLPEERIMSNRQNASAGLAKGMVDAIGEVGNLLVGSWDRVFSERLEGHNHFSHRLPAFVGKPWGKSEETIGLAGDEEVFFLPYEMTVGSYPAFNYGVIFPKKIFAGSSDVAPEEANRTKENTREKNKENSQNTQTATEKTNSKKSRKVKKAKRKKSKPNEPTAKKAPVEITDAGMDKVSEAIRKIAQSSAVLPGQSAKAKKETHGVTGDLFEIRANDIMQNKVTWASPDESLQQAHAKMQQTDAGYIMIGQNGILEGIVSKSDITRAMSPYLQPIFAKWRRPLDDATLKIRIKWIMSRPVRTIKPETSLAAIMEYMSQFRGRCLPVTDEQGNVQGLVTTFDIFQALLQNNSNTCSEGQTTQALVESASPTRTT